MATSKQVIIDDITDHFEGNSYKDCYVEIISDLNQRLFADHKVSTGTGHLITRKASSAKVAREIEQHFLDKGMDGRSGGGDNDSEIVYAYKKKTGTKT